MRQTLNPGNKLVMNHSLVLDVIDEAKSGKAGTGEKAETTTESDETTKDENKKKEASNEKRSGAGDGSS